jgi:hypothetical protein
MFWWSDKYILVLEILAIPFILVGNCDLMQQCWFFVCLLALYITQCNFVFPALCT